MTQGIVVLVHGYLDGPQVWRRLIDEPAPHGWDIVSVALPQGTADAGSDRQLEGYAADVVRQVELLAAVAQAPVVMIGHSMGAQVAELAALNLRDRLAGLVLVTPAPLAGYALPPAVMARFVDRAGMTDREAIVAGKRALAVALDAGALDILVDGTLATPRQDALAQLRAWTGGHPAGQAPSALRCAVLCVSTDDTFITEDLVAATAMRFSDARIEKVPRAGHWPQLEQPAALADLLRRFIAALPPPSRA
ncbi:alpha/beta fold hydrolase [Cupriavidus sp. CuC1]|uniref:alpha/beta fold hydrolase n=1 Tax=Cupriavidus sp. CuC1 TaxID=3373131 RepID=UPI0037D2EF39